MPLVPIALATGWSAAVLFALRIPLNPMSATLGALVIAISTEFAVLLDGRYREERAAGHARRRRRSRRTYRSTGAAVLASGATAIAGFAVLAFSDVRMLREFGIVTVVDLSVSLLGVLAVLPAVLVLAERRRGARAGGRGRRRSPTGPSRREGRLARRRGRRRRARLHHAEHAPHRGRRLAGLERGTRLPPFAMPLATSAREADANIATEPDSGPEGERPACRVRGPEVLNVCELAERGPVVLAFVVTRSGDCERQVDVLDRVAARFPDVRVRRGGGARRPRRLRRRCASAAGASRSATTTTARSRTSTASAGLPDVHVRGPRRRVAGTALGFLDEAQLARRARALAAGRPLP